MSCFTVHGQHLDSVQLDLKNLSGIEFFKKYSFSDDTPSIEDINVTKLVWSLHHLRKVDESLRQNGVKTGTIIENRPSKENHYYIIGHYQLPTPDHMFRLSFYKVKIPSNTVDYQSWVDIIKNKWKRIN